MKNAASLSPQRKKAKELYESTFITASIAAGAIFTLANMVAIVLIHWLSLKFGFGRYYGGNWGPIISPGAIVFGNFWARRKVRQAGLSQESVTIEAIPKTATIFAGDPMQWPGGTRTKAEAVALGSIVLMISLFGWMMWRYMASDWLSQVESAFFFVACLVMAVVVFFSSSPSVRIDDTGVTTAPKAPWRRHISWKDVDCCEIKRTTSIYGTPFAPTCFLKNQEGKVLMKLLKVQRQSLPLPGQPHEQVELETELKRRLSGNLAAA